MMPPFQTLTTTMLLTLLLFSGCATTSQHAENPDDEILDVDAPSMVYLSAAENEAISWDTLLTRARAADIVIIAEQHDDPLAHRVQAAVVEALVSEKQTAVCMEMLERNEQPFVDAFLADTITKDTLVDITQSKDWGAKGKWDSFYQPVLDAAKAHASPVIAANAPRAFTRLAHLESFDGLASFASSYPDHFVVPTPIAQEAYAERFKDTMRDHSSPPAPQGKGTSKKTSEASFVMPALSEEKLESIFRAQQVWDATMADSVSRACEQVGRAVLLVGQFHTDHQGGLLLRLMAAQPARKILTISVQAASATALREEDQGRADIVVFRPVVQ